MIWTDSTYNIGEFKVDKYHGKGTLYFNEGTNKTGEWKMVDFKDLNRSLIKSSLNLNYERFLIDLIIDLFFV